MWIKTKKVICNYRIIVLGGALIVMRYTFSQYKGAKNEASSICFDYFIATV